MRRLERALNKHGFDTVNVVYPSHTLAIRSLAKMAIESGLEACHKKGAASIHFVTHSLGGILVHQYTQQTSIEGLQKIVMLGPPNQGSEVVDRLKKLAGFKIINGPTAVELGTNEHDLPLYLGPVNFELGVIAGTRSVNPILSTLIPERNDGKVAVEKTKIEGMKDFIDLPVSHPFMMRNPEVIRQTIYILERGEFGHVD
jgi:hypothetical protein